MKQLLFGILIFLSTHTFSQLSPEPFAIEMEAVSMSGLPGFHSFSWGKTSDGKWIVIGGRVDGLHQRQPFSAFLAQDNNTNVTVIDVNASQVWTSDLSVLNTPIYEQLQSTNQNFIQRDSTLYIIGGYGYSATQDDHITYPNLTAIDINGLANAVISSQPIDPYFRQIINTDLKITGGQMGMIDSTFYLVGGQLFDGRYNPMGPEFGPGFVQEYSNAIKTFKIDDDGINMIVYDYTSVEDSLNLHRRDYNMSKQIFPGGEEGFTAFSGVFDVNDLPFLNSVDITPSGYTVNNSFNQMLSQYHSAKISLYDSTSEAMHTLFFGGMSQFYLDANNNLIEDTNVPFVKTISKVTRLSDGSMQESALNYIEMPALLGSGAEFIPAGDYLIENEIIDLNAIPDAKTLIGYILGGIESTEQNIFFVNDGSQSSAYAGVFAVYINKSIVGMEEHYLNGDTAQSDRIFPNPAKKEISFKYNLSFPGTVVFDIIDSEGKVVYAPHIQELTEGTYTSTLDVSHLSKGIYYVRVNNGSVHKTYKFIKK